MRYLLIDLQEIDEQLEEQDCIERKEKAQKASRMQARLARMYAGRAAICVHLEWLYKEGLQSTERGLHWSRNSGLNETLKDLEDRLEKLCAYQRRTMAS